MTNILYLLIKNQSTLGKLREELDTNLGEETIPSYSSVKDLPYLNACINEGLRLRPPLSLGLPRKTTSDTIIAGYTIKAGTTVSVPTWSLHHSQDLFADADSFVPERWLEDNIDDLKKYVMPFSQGPRACIGRNLAFLEMLVIIPTLIRKYDFTFERSDFELEALDRHVANPGDCPVHVRNRKQ